MEWQVLMGEEINVTVDATDFNNAQMSRWCDRIVFLEEEATADDSWNFTQDVPKLDGFNKWYKWLEAMETALQRKWTPGMGILMSYLIRKEAAAIPWTDIAADDPRYEDMDTLLIQTIQLRGPVFKRHNQLLFDNLKNLTTDGDCWQFIQQLKAQNNRNGREAFLLLKQQAEGDEARKARVQAARDAIRTTMYHGKKNFPFSWYVTAHVAAHNILRQEKDTHGRSHEPPKDDKVSDFLKNIKDSRLDAAKTFVRGSEEHRNNFTRARSSTCLTKLRKSSGM